jgi:SAM-dependent methyltransferase
MNETHTDRSAVLAYWCLRVLRGLGASDPSHALSPDGPEGWQAAEEQSSENWKRYFAQFGIADIVPHGVRVLDIGCGYGGTLLAWADAGRDSFWIGVEPFPRMAAIAERTRRAPNARFLCAAGEGLPFKDQSFDLIVTNHTMEHVTDPRMVVSECLRCLKPGGQSLHVFPPYYSVLGHHLTWIAWAPGLHYFFSAEALTAAVNRLIAEGRLHHTPLVVRQQRPWDRAALPSMNGCTIRDWRRFCDTLPARVNHAFVPFGANLLHTHRAKHSSTLRRVLRAFAAVTRLGHRVWPETDLFVGEIHTSITTPGIADDLSENRRGSRAEQDLTPLR